MIGLIVSYRPSNKCSTSKTTNWLAKNQHRVSDLLWHRSLVSFRHIIHLCCSIYALFYHFCSPETQAYQLNVAACCSTFWCPEWCLCSHVYQRNLSLLQIAVQAFIILTTNKPAKILQMSWVMSTCPIKTEHDYIQHNKNKCEWRVSVSINMLHIIVPPHIDHTALRSIEIVLQSNADKMYKYVVLITL